MKINKLRLKKILILTIAISLIFTQSAFPVLAIEAPSAPTSPTSPPAPNESPTAPTTPPPPTSPSSETQDSESSESEKSSSPEPSKSKSSSMDKTESQSEDIGGSNSPASSAQSNQYDGDYGGKVGNTLIQTGNATNDAAISTLGNNNLSSASANPGAANRTNVANIGNGSGSNNAASLDSETNSNTLQDNNANVGNNLFQNTTTGKNDASQNVGDAIIKTGDANTSGTIITNVNTNIDGVSVSQFQVDDVHTGDLVLDFTANCIINCGGSVLAANSGNGSNSNNSASIDTLSNDNTFQNNDASVENSLILSSNSGDNKTSQNTGGDSFIQTGDANVSANVLTFANNNFSGNVIFGVVDIFGTLNGDIILTDEAIAQILGGSCATCPPNNTTASNTSNGSNSDNNVLVNQETNNNTFQTNNANIQNNLNLTATTGENSAGQNTGGDTFIQTGNSDINAQTVNIANSNVDGDNWWLVIVNKAGQWVGQLLGAPTGSLVAGSQGSEFTISDTGEITATNKGNGSDSTDNAAVNQQSNNTTVQTNNANIVNNLDLSANTGGNDASQNTGGSNTIKTGDAKIIANLVNFVNNNVIGNGSLVVTFVNVFGNWFGDFVTPGYQKNNNSNPEEDVSDLVPNTDNIGGPSNSASPSEPSQNNNVNNSNNNNNSSNETVNEPISLASNPSTPPNPSTSPNPSSAQILKVAGASSAQIPDLITEANESNSKSKGVSINLAWLLVFLPATLTYIAVKKKLNPLKLFLRKTS